MHEKQERAQDEEAQKVLDKEATKAERRRLLEAGAGAVDEEHEEESDEDDDEDVDESDTSEFAKLVRARKQREKAEAAAAKAEREEVEALETQRAKEQAAGRIEIQAYCCAALQNFSAHAAHEKTVRDEGGIGCIVAALRAHPLCAAIQLHGESLQETNVLPRHAASCNGPISHSTSFLTDGLQCDVVWTICVCMQDCWRYVTCLPTRRRRGLWQRMAPRCMLRLHDTILHLKQNGSL